jgi:hypothetical protein
MLTVLKENKDVHFVTPYDHLDYYINPLHNRNGYKLIRGGDRVWHSATSTCLTFLTNRKNLGKVLPVFKTYLKNNSDYAIWAAITKFNSQPVKIFVSNLTSNFFAKALVKAHLFTLKQLYFHKKMNLYAPIPSIATHMQYDELAPGVDWNEIISSVPLIYKNGSKG